MSFIVYIMIKNQKSTYSYGLQWNIQWNGFLNPFLFLYIVRTKKIELYWMIIPLFVNKISLYLTATVIIHQAHSSRLLWIHFWICFTFIRLWRFDSWWRTTATKTIVNEACIVQNVSFIVAKWDVFVTFVQQSLKIWTTNSV